MGRRHTQKGFTLLELLVTMCIIGAVYTVAAQSGLANWGKKKSSVNTATFLKNELATLKDHALSKSTTTRMVVSLTANGYTLTTYYSSSPTTSCSSAGSWTIIQNAASIDIHSNYQITGSGMTNTCFYRDGSSSGGTFVVSPSASGTSDKTYTVDISIATGYVTITES